MNGKGGRLAVLAAMLLIGLIRGVPAQQPDSGLWGYRLGQKWSETGRDLPCRTDSLFYKLRDKTCTGREDVELIFVGNTLYHIQYFVTDDGPPFFEPAEDLWLRFWKSWSLARFGLPDSVSKVDSDRRSAVRAWWSRPSKLILITIWENSSSQRTIYVQLCRPGKEVGAKCVVEHYNGLVLRPVRGF